MRGWILGCAAILATSADGPEVSARMANGQASCCYVNSQYAGVCAVVPAGGETCGSILAYLNNPRSQGKSYCQNTEVRGRWERRRCSVPTATPAVSAGSSRVAGP
jgi:hypothetical protein